MRNLNKAFLLITPLIILLSFSAKVFADQSMCDSDDVHCAYITGGSNNDNDGRYLKLAIKGQSAVVCMNNRSAFSVTQDLAADFLGKNEALFYICKDRAGNGCQLIGKDDFIISKNGDKYQGIPEFYNIDLSSLQNQYPKCNASDPTKFKLFR
jgi:hypothetical protein